MRRIAQMAVANRPDLRDSKDQLLDPQLGPGESEDVADVEAGGG